MQEPVSIVRQRFIHIKAPARLHLGFLDLNGGLGRHFGSIGMAVDSHFTEISLTQTASSDLRISEIAQNKISRLINQFYLTLGSTIPSDSRLSQLSISSLIPEHAGLGSGTQLALVIGHLLAHHHHIEASTSDIAQAMDRGKRSGIGISTFDSGGFIVDAGLGANSTLPVHLFRHDFPSEWRLVMLMDTSYQGIHGQTEIQAFQQLPDFPLQHSQQICHLTLMQLLPALIEKDIEQFGRAVTQIQFLIGQHFAPAQGGQYSSHAIGCLMEEAQKMGFTGMAQSSWGPTSCIFAKSQAQADHLMAELQQKIDADSKLQNIALSTAAGVNQGASITISDEVL